MKQQLYELPLRKHAYSNILKFPNILNTLKISPPKTETFQIKILISTHNLCFEQK